MNNRPNITQQFKPVNFQVAIQVNDINGKMENVLDHITAISPDSYFPHFFHLPANSNLYFPGIYHTYLYPQGCQNT